MIQSEEEQVAIAQYAHSHTRPIMDKDGTKLGSCVLVQIEERVLLVTAAHVLGHGSPSLLLTESLNIRLEEFARVEMDEEDDVGFAEVDRKHLDSVLRIAIPWTQIDHRTLDSDDRVVVCGYPSDLNQEIGKLPISSAQHTVIREYAAHTYMTVPKPRTEWPSTGLDRPCNENTDFFLYWEPTDKSHILEPGTTSLEEANSVHAVPTMPGMSGGGVWLEVDSADKIWQARLKLVGIQVSWKPGEGWLRATRISRWVDLVKSAYGDIQS